MALLTNNKYELKISYDGQQTTKEFITELTPYYASIAQIRTTPIKTFVSDIADKEIMFKIYDNSKLAQQLSKEHDNDDWIGDEDIPYYVINYVITKTKYDIFLAQYLNIAKQNSRSIDLADFSVDSGEMDGLKDLLDDLEDEYKYWEDKLTGVGEASPVSVVKAEGSYPFENRSELATPSN